MVFYVRFLANLLKFSIGMAWGGPLFESDLNKCLGSKIRLWFKSFPRPLLKSGLQPLDRYSIHQETISRKPEQMYTPSYTRLEWLGKGPLSKLDSNKHWRAKMQPLFESTLGHYWSQAWVLVQIWHLPDHKWETWTGVSSIWPKIGMAWGGAII